MEHRIHLVCGYVVVVVSLFYSFDLLIWHLRVIPINILNNCNAASRGFFKFINRDPILLLKQIFRSFDDTYYFKTKRK